MCLSKEDAHEKLVRWGSWHYRNSGYVNLTYSSNNKMSRDHLATAACGGGNKVEHFEEMPGEIAITGAELTKLGRDQLDVVEWMYITDYDVSVSQRVSYAKRFYLRKYLVSHHVFKTRMNALWVALRVLLDDHKISNNHPYLDHISKKIALQVRL